MPSSENMPCQFRYFNSVVCGAAKFEQDPHKASGDTKKGRCKLEELAGGREPAADWRMRFVSSM